MKDTFKSIAYNCLHLGYLVVRRDFTAKEKIKCLKWWTNSYGQRNLWATLPRSGQHWLELMINVAHDITNGWDGDYSYVNGYWLVGNRKQITVDAYNWRSAVKYDPDEMGKLIFHTHQPYYRLVNWKKGKMKTMILIRNIYDQAKSFCRYQGIDQDAFIKAGYIDRTIDFYNSWGRFAKKNAVFVLQYEKIIKYPKEMLEHISYFFDLGLTDESISKAVESCTKEKMRERIPKKLQHSNMRVTPDEWNFEFSDKNMEIIQRKMKKKLKYNFGYEY